MADEFHVHQCPYCELRFRYANEVKDHVIHDHPDHAKSFAMADPLEHRGPSPLHHEGRDH
jgi:hypothetical protein